MGLVLVGLVAYLVGLAVEHRLAARRLRGRCPHPAERVVVLYGDAVNYARHRCWCDLCGQPLPMP